MKKNVLSVLVTVLSASAMLAQEVKESKVDQGSGFNHWSVDLNGGFGKPVAPFSPGYSTKTFAITQADLGVRYMFNNKFGLKTDFGLTSFGSDAHQTTKKFEGKYMRINLQGVVNMGRVLNFEDWTSRLGLILHAGPGYSWMTNQDVSGKDQMVNLLGGLTGQLRLTNRIALNADLTAIANFKQNRTFEGQVSPRSSARFYNGGVIEATVGLSIYLGKNAKHADWYVSGAGLGSDDAKDKLAALQNKVDDLQSKLLDTDGDGVIDAVDEEKESAKGAIVDTKGRSTDLNNNGIPDTTDKVIAANKAETTAAIKAVATANPSTTSNSTNNAPAQTPGQAASTVDATKLINDGYIAAYFNLGDARPNNNSAEGIGFVLTYLRNNPTTSVDIIGNTDETGTVEFNNKLANQRALNVKNILMKAGVSANRLNIVAKGEDKSVDIKSADARKLVRKVIFHIK